MPEKDKIHAANILGFGIRRLLLLSLLALAACKNDQNLYSKALVSKLSGLQALPFSEAQQDSMYRVLRDSALTFPVYSAEGKQLTQAEIREQRVNMRVDCFGKDTAGGIAAAVFRKATPEEVETHMKKAAEQHDDHEARVKKLVGQQAPDFTAKDMAGNEVSLSKLRGKVVVLNFWFVRCHACVEEMPELNQTVENFKNKGVEFLALNFDKRDETQWFLENKAQFDYQIIPEAQGIFDQYGIQPCPVSIVIDPNGTIVSADMSYEAHEQLSYKKLQAAIQLALSKVGKP